MATCEYVPAKTTTKVVVQKEEEYILRLNRLEAKMVMSLCGNFTTHGLIRESLDSIYDSLYDEMNVILGASEWMEHGRDGTFKLRKDAEEVLTGKKA